MYKLTQHQLMQRYGFGYKRTVFIENIGRPVSLNRKDHWLVLYQLHKKWKQAGKRAARKKFGKRSLPTPVKIEVVPLNLDGRWMADPGNCMPSVKAVVDGWVEMKLLPDDSGKFVSQINLHRPIKCGRIGLMLNIKSV